MGCSHAGECPLFPLLNASLRDWRNYYCDSADGWRDCARYKLSKTGRLVPITLLPNGSDALHLRGIPSADGSRGIQPVQPAQPAQPVQPVQPAQAAQPAHLGQPSHIPTPRTPAAWFEPAPAPPTPPTRPTPPAPPAAPPAPEPAWGFNPAPPVQVPHRSGIPSARQVRPVIPRRRRWWNRLADWIAGPA